MQRSIKQKTKKKQKLTDTKIRNYIFSNRYGTLHRLPDLLRRNCNCSMGDFGALRISTSYSAPVYFTGRAVGVCGVILMVVLFFFLVVWGLMVVGGFSCHSVPFGVLSSPGFLGVIVWAFVADANLYLLHLAVWVGAGLPILRHLSDAKTSAPLLTNH